MHFLLELLSVAINIYVLIIIIQVAMSWLIAFEMVNAENQQAQNLMNLLRKATDPVFKPVRKYIPPIGGIDLTPLVVIIGIQVIFSLLVGLLI